MEIHGEKILLTSPLKSLNTLCLERRIYHKTFWWPSEPRTRTTWAKKHILDGNAVSYCGRRTTSKADVHVREYSKE